MKLTDVSVLRRNKVWCVIVSIEYQGVRVKEIAYGRGLYPTAQEAVNKATGYKKITRPENGETLEKFLERHLKNCRGTAVPQFRRS